ncbi:MAG: zinc ribbon domain-containing protein [Maricaulaceae bacterium]
MAKSTRRPQQLYTVVMWLLSIIFAGFLIGLGSLIIADLPRVDGEIRVEEFMAPAVLKQADAEIRKRQNTLGPLQNDMQDFRSEVKSAQAEYQSQKASLDNWLRTRVATESQSQNAEVISRTRAVEELKKAERRTERIYAEKQAAFQTAERALINARNERRQIESAAYPAYRKALRGQELRVFLLRLALTLPLLLIAGWLVAKKRASAYWPLYRGFILFALFAFFFELAPYLPSYGGYVRYTVGIILVFIAGQFIIRAMRRYIERKQAEESRSEGERRQSIEYETALKKIAAKTCPGCDRSIVAREDIDTDFCVHCGIRLKEKCGSCGEKNISFHRFCLCCGEATNSGTAEA